MEKSTMMSIGAVARAVDLTEGTLRNWERRYGFPKPERTKGGHRVYRAEVVTVLKLVRSAMRAGHRPAQLLSMNVEQLEALVQKQGQVVRLPSSAPGPQLESDFLSAVRSFKSSVLFKSFRSRVAKAGLLRFVQEDAWDILKSLGSAWEAGEIEIEHEHFAAEVLRDFLTSEWRSLNVNAGAPLVVCGTLSGEQHGLGLHLAACCLVANGFQVLFLGTDLPPTSIAATVKENRGVAVAISMSEFSETASNDMLLRELRALLPSSIELWVGGGGSQGVQVGDASFIDLLAFSEFLTERLPELSARKNEAL